MRGRRGGGEEGVRKGGVRRGDKGGGVKRWVDRVG